ncbi:MAG TPA: DUF368 domain-containing protein, partial [Lachnospiraceae bacterium]|nr:DUF368 domain-containing protein [Lachnospiraceae bacterium]
LKGVVIGVANAIPGVSGGTMMVSMGVYDDIIYCITHLFKQMKKSVLILLPYFIGMAAGIVGLAFSIKSLYANFPFQTSMVFIGLIIGGVPMLYGHVKKTTIKIVHILLFLFFFAAIIAMEYFGGNGKDVILSVDIISIVKIFLIGILASATMVIPGVSGSMMLMILGYYNPIINAITDFITALANRRWNTILNICGSLVPFGLGVVIGIFAIAKIIEILLKHFEAHTYCAILGLVMSSPVVILMGTDMAGINIVAIVTGVICLIAGTLAARQLGK